MKNKTDPKFTQMQRRVLDQSEPEEILRIYIRNSKGRILTVQSGHLVIVPVFWKLPLLAWDLQDLYLEIKHIFSTDFATHVCESLGNPEELKAVCDWLLSCESMNRILGRSEWE